MQKDYVRHLEALILDSLLPVYHKYYALTGEEKPALDVSILPRKVPALLKGDLKFASDRVKPRKN